MHHYTLFNFSHCSRYLSSFRIQNCKVEAMVYNDALYVVLMHLIG